MGSKLVMDILGAGGKAFFEVGAVVGYGLNGTFLFSWEPLMPTLFAARVSTEDVAVPPFPVRRFSVETYFELGRLGLLGDEENCELLDGWVVPKFDKTPLHDDRVDFLLGLLNAKLPAGWFVRLQNVLQTPTSAPEPDFAIVRGKRGGFSNQHPQGSDVGLVIEVADSSLAVDRRKADIYAAAGIPEYWIVNLRDRRVEVFGNLGPRANGAMLYAPTRILRAHESLNLVLDDEIAGHLACRDILPSSNGS